MIQENSDTDLWSWSEWKNLLKNKIMVLSVCVLALIPIIYAGILLSSYWDPFGKTSNLPVAVVNEDKAQTLEGTKINIGKEMLAHAHKFLINELGLIKGITENQIKSFC